MVTANFLHDGNVGTLFLKTHFGQEFSIRCEKSDDEIFRLGGTAAQEIITYEGLITTLSSPYCHFKAFRTLENTFEDKAYLSPEPWTDADLHCYITEYYSLDMEGHPHEWFVSKTPLQDANYLFVNLDVIDGGGNLLKRYRVSPFTGQYKVINAASAF